MPGSPLSDPSWAAQAADTVVKVVDEIRRRTTRPLILAARAIVFGLVAVFGIVLALVLGTIATLRGLQAAIAWPSDLENAVWISYVAIGGLFLLGGTIAMAKRHPRAGDA